MAWVRPKHPPKRVEVDPAESLRPLLEYFSCRPSASNTNNKQLIRMPKPQLLLHDSYSPRPQKKHHDKESEHHQRPDHHHRGTDHQSTDHRSRAEHHQRIDDYQEADHHTSDHSRASYHERASQRSISHYAREPSPPPPPLPSYRPNARPGAHLRLMPSRQRVAADTYIPRRPASRWASATTPLQM